MFKNTKHGRDDDFFPIFAGFVSPSFTSPPQKLWENIKKRVFHLLISEKPQETKMDIICPKWGKAPYLIP